MSSRQQLGVRLSAIALALLATTAFCLLFTHHSTVPLIGRYSISALSALGLAFLLAALALVVALLPPRSMDRLTRWIQEGRAQLAGANSDGFARHGIILLVASLVVFLSLGIKGVRQNQSPMDDQYVYLEQARAIRAGGGPVSLVADLYAGRYVEANQHPLYPALLALAPEFEFAKGCSIAFGAILLVGTWCILVSRAGWLVAGAAAALLATNSALLESASLVSCETLLACCASLAWWTALWKPDRPWLAPLLVGVWLGLAYWAKASGFFLLAGYVIWSVLQPEWRRIGWLSLLSFSAIASPLLVRNVRVYGNPLYSFNTRFLFADSFDHGMTQEYQGAPAAVRRYWQGHGLGDIGRRALHGGAWESFILLRSLGPMGLGQNRALVGTLMLCGAIIGAALRPGGWGLAGVWTLLFWTFFAWYVPIAASDRFLVPIVPVLAVLAADAAVRCLAATAGQESKQRAQRVLLSFLLWLLVVLLLALAS